MKSCKGMDGAIIVTPAIEAPLYLLPKDSPHIKAGDNGTAQERICHRNLN